MHLAQELLTSTQSIQWWFKKFCKGEESFEDEECSGQPLEVDNDQLRGSPKLILLQLHEKLPKNSVLTITIVQHLKQIGKVKKFYKGMPHELTGKKKSFKILCNNNKPFHNQIVKCNEKWILCDNQQRPAQWSLNLRNEAPKHFPKPNLHQEKVMVTVWWSAAGLIHNSFLNPSETITFEKYAQ